MNNDLNKQIIKPAKCCYNCIFFNNSIDYLQGSCQANINNDQQSDVYVYPYEYCKLFKMIKHKKNFN